MGYNNRQFFGLKSLSRIALRKKHRPQQQRTTFWELCGALCYPSTFSNFLSYFWKFENLKQILLPRVVFSLFLSFFLSLSLSLSLSVYLSLYLSLPFSLSISLSAARERPINNSVVQFLVSLYAYFLKGVFSVSFQFVFSWTRGISLIAFSLNLVALGWHSNWKSEPELQPQKNVFEAK